jgi:hypothetical protein
MIDIDIKPGDLLFLTKAFEDYFLKKNPKSKISLVNRLAKLEDVIDWDSEKGQIIKLAREKSGKWKNLPIEENKYIVSIFYHDLIGRNKERGVVERGVPMFRYNPITREPFFEKVPNWIYTNIMKQCEVFSVELTEED